MSTSATFKDENRALQELVRELLMVRAHNKSFRDGEPLNNVLLFAEAGLVCMTFEHFVRVVVAKADTTNALAGQSLYNLLQFAISRDLIRLPWDAQEDGIRKVVDVRNSLLHANYAEAAHGAASGSVENYFKTQFASELEVMFLIVDDLMKQVDVNTGRPFARLKTDDAGQ